MAEPERKIFSAKDFGEAVRQRRKEMCLTQAAFSEMTGISASFLSDLENGKPTVELEKSVYVANMLGLDLNVRKRGQSDE